MTPTFEKARRLVVYAALALFAAGLAFFAYIGTYTRFWADDYCYSAYLIQGGWWQGIVNWYLTSGNRFSSIATVGVIDLFGPRAVQVLPALLLILWAAAWYFFLSEALKAAGWKGNRAWLLLVAFVQVYFITLLSPDRIQVVYWRMAALHYSLPLPLLLLLLGLTARFLRPAARSVTIWMLVLTALSAFYMAGHSETTTAFLAAVFGIGFVAAGLLLNNRARSNALALTAVSLAAALLGLLLMFFSPGNAHRALAMPRPDNLFLIFPYSARYVFDFIFFSVRGQIIPYGVLVLLSVAISVLLLQDGQISFSNRSLALGALSTLIVTFTLMVASFLPSAYAGLQYPGPRALMPASFLLVLGASLAAFWAGAALLKWIPPASARGITILALLVVLAASLYPIRAVPILTAERSTLAAWAERWDARDQEIRAAAAGGVRDIRVREMEVIHNLEDLGPVPYHWVNRCAAIYYGVDTITADP